MASSFPAPRWQPGLKFARMGAVGVPAIVASLHSPFHHHKKPQFAHDRKLLQGTWVKDKSASDSMKDAMDAVALNGIVRQAVKLVKGIKIFEDNERDTWTMQVFSVISWFKVTETYSLSGNYSTCKRRDLRRGHHTSRLLVDSPGPHGGLVLELSWGEPHGGGGTDEFVLAPRGTAAAQARARAAAPAVVAHAGVVDADTLAAARAASIVDPHPSEQELHVYSMLKLADREVHYRTVYTRK